MASDVKHILEEVGEILTKREGQRQVISEIAKYWSTYLGMALDENDVCALMCLLKIARIGSNNLHRDSWVDLIGYATLGTKEVDKYASNKEGR